MQEITVAYASNEMCQLADAVYLKDAIDDLPPVCSFRHKYLYCEYSFFDSYKILMSCLSLDFIY
jgi:hypothetical protein